MTEAPKDRPPVAPSVSPTVTVVVVARNEAQNIAACAGSLAAQDYPDLRVILVDDGSTDATVSLAEEACPGIRVISSPTRSISRNRNVGWQAAQSAYVAFLDADCEAPRGWVSALVAKSQETGAAAVGGGNRPPASESPHYAALEIMLQTFVGSRGSVQGQMPADGRFVPHLPGLNVLYRTDALRLVGGFDTRFARMGEDEDLSRRLTDLGLKLYVTPDATVIHRQRADLTSWARNMRGYGRGRTWLLRRHPNGASPLFLLPQAALLALPLYLPVIALYAAWVSLRSGRPMLWPRLVALFAATHLAYGFGQIEGYFIRGDNDLAAQKRRRVALLALKNAGNKGDEAISVCVLDRLVRETQQREAPMDLYLGAIGPSGFDIRPVPQDAAARVQMIGDMLAPAGDSRDIDAATYLQAFRLVSVLTWFQGMLIAGGQWLHDLSFPKHLVICAMFGWAKICRTGTGVFCVGVGPLRRKISRRLLRLAFSRKSLMVTRDERSTALLVDCGFSQAVTASDPAIELAGIEAPASKGKILISPCAWSSFENIYARNGAEIDKSVELWKKLITTLKERDNAVAFLPTMNPEDTEFAYKIIDGLDGIDVIDTRHLSPQEVQGYIACARALVTMRLHPAIFASNAGTPFVALNYADKVKAFCDQAGFEDRLVDIRSSDWADKALDLLEGDSGLQPRHREMRSAQIGSLAAGYDRLFGWLGLEGGRVAAPEQAAPEIASPLERMPLKKQN